jgi:hypothetical protein
MSSKWWEEEESLFGEKCARSERFLKTLAAIILVAEIVANLLDNNNMSINSNNSQERISVDDKRTPLLTGSLLPMIAPTRTLASVRHFMARANWSN